MTQHRQLRAAVLNRNLQDLTRCGVKFGAEASGKDMEESCQHVAVALVLVVVVVVLVMVVALAEALQYQLKRNEDRFTKHLPTWVSMTQRRDKKQTARRVYQQAS